MNHNRIVISVVCYNNVQEIYEFASQLSKQKNAKNLVILVTINMNRDEIDVESVLEGVNIESHVYNPHKNLGYLHGCLFGLRQYNSDYDWALISNTDLVFTQDDFFERLISSGCNDDIWCIGPDIVLKIDLEHQNPFLNNNISKEKFQFLTKVFSNQVSFLIYQKLSRLRKKFSPRRQVANSRFVFSVHGSCFLLKRECAQMLMNEKFDELFMYGEELFLASIINSMNKLIYYESLATILHNENQSTNTVSVLNRQKWYKNSYKYLLERFYR